MAKNPNQNLNPTPSKREPSTREPSTRERGLSAELKVRQALEAGGYHFVESNFQWKGGEIDLVFVDALGVLVFVEVRSAAAASPWLRYTITPAKQRRLINTALRYRMARTSTSGRRAFRFDMVWVEGDHFEHWKNVMMV